MPAILAAWTHSMETACQQTWRLNWKAGFSGGSRLAYGRDRTHGFCFLRALRSKRHWELLPKCTARIRAFLSEQWVSSKMAICLRFSKATRIFCGRREIACTKFLTSS
jgi:hypothetical protein